MQCRARGLSAIDFDNFDFQEEQTDQRSRAPQLEKSNSFSSTVLSSLAPNELLDDLGENRSFGTSTTGEVVPKRQRKKAFDESEEICHQEFKLKLQKALQQAELASQEEKDSKKEKKSRKVTFDINFENSQCQQPIVQDQGEKMDSSQTSSPQKDQTKEDVWFDDEVQMRLRRKVLDD